MLIGLRVSVDTFSHMRSHSLSDAPAELQVAIAEFWQEEERDNAAAIAFLESGYDAFAILDTTNGDRPCGTRFTDALGRDVSAERSVGYFQINSCNFPDWEWQRFYNARHNAGTAHLIWTQQGWAAWFYSATKLGLI